MHWGGEMLSYYEVPQLSELFAVYTDLTESDYLHPSVLTDVAIDIESIISLVVTFTPHGLFIDSTY